MPEIHNCGIRDCERYIERAIMIEICDSYSGWSRSNGSDLRGDLKCPISIAQKEHRRIGSNNGVSLAIRVEVTKSDIGWIRTCGVHRWGCQEW
jgi:hypothetical protein